MKKKLTIYVAFWLFQILTFQLYSQDDIKNYKQPDVSQGTSVIIGGDLKYNDFHNPAGSYITDFRAADVNTQLNGIHWKFTSKISYGIFVSVSGLYHYQRQKDESKIPPIPSSEIIKEYSQIHGKLYGTGEYYLNKKLFAGAAYEGSLNYSSSYQYSNNLPYPNGSSNSLYGYSIFWFSTGYGKILNAARITKSFNFEKILKKEGLIKSLSPQMKSKLTELLDKRNNKDYLSKYKDDDEIVFFRNVENLLITEGIISKPLGAETTLRMYQALTNDKFLYYPKYQGFRTQLDLQLNPTDNNPGNNYLILSGIYGFPIFKKTRGVIAAFTALPLSKKINGYGLFSTIRNPFSNALPVIVEQFQLDKYNQNFYGITMGEYITNLINITGFKMHVFHTFSSYAGVILHGQYLYSKPRDLANFSEFDAGMQIDYNILSFIKLSGNVDLIKNNRAYSAIGFSMGTTIIIF